MDLTFCTSLKSLNQSLHKEVLTPLLVLIAIGLELPEDYFTDKHKYDEESSVSCTLARLLISGPN